MVKRNVTLTIALAAGIATAVPGRAHASKIVVLGDSLTSGHGIGTARAFPAVLQERIDANELGFTVVNAGIAGDTTGGALRLVVALGANDGLRGVPVAQVKANLSRIIESAQERGIAVLLCGMEALPIYGWDYSLEFHNAYRALASKYGVPLVPFMLMNVIGNVALMQPDRAHPNAAGARTIADNIWPYLEDVLASRAWENAPSSSRSSR
jgi:acyl-CoA thioesterase-1